MEASSQRSGLLDFWRYVSGMDQASPPFRVTITRMHGGLPEGATAHVVPLGIRVTSDSGFAYDMPFAAMKLDATGLESEFVSCRDATLVISSDIPAFHDALRAHGLGGGKDVSDPRDRQKGRTAGPRGDDRVARKDDRGRNAVQRTDVDGDCRESRESSFVLEE